MRTEVASADFYKSPWGTKHPRMQLLTIKDLLAGKRVDYPAASQTNVTFKKAPKATLIARDVAQLQYGDKDED